MPKGIVITTDPNYYIYIETLQRKGFTICAIPEDSDGMRVDVLEAQLKTIHTESISFFYIVTINNPSSVVMANHRKKQIVQIATNLSRVPTPGGCCRQVLGIGPGNLFCYCKTTATEQMYIPLQC